MNKKLFSGILATVLVFCMAGTTFALDKVTINDMPGTAKTVNFEGLEAGKNLKDNSLGTGIGVDGPTSAEVSLNGNKRSAIASIASFPKAGNSENMVLKFDPYISKAYVTAEERALMTLTPKISGTETTINAFEKKGIGSTGAEIDCYVTYLSGNNDLKMWYKKDALGDAVAVTDNMWFKADGTPVESGSNATIATFANGFTATQVGGKYVGTYSASLDIYKPRTEAWTTTGGLDDAAGFQLNHFMSDVNEDKFYLGRNYLKANSGDIAVYTDNNVPRTVKKGAYARHLGASAEITGIVQGTSSLVPMIDFADKWVNITVVASFDEDVFRIYVDGKPAFFDIGGGYYSSECALKQDGTFPTVGVSAYRLNNYIGNDVCVDNVVIKYDADAKTIGSSETQIKPSLANSDGIDAYMGAMISTTLPDGTLTKMKWVFNTPTTRLYSTQTLTPNVAVSGNVKFAAVLKNGIVSDGAITGTKDIIGVDAIFEVDGTNFYTNAIDKANFGREIG